MINRKLIEARKAKGWTQTYLALQLAVSPITPEEICSFVFSHEPFTPGDHFCLYHALVHEFGRMGKQRHIFLLKAVTQENHPYSPLCKGGF